jgi:TonB family protein
MARNASSRSLWRQVDSARIWGLVATFGLAGFLFARLMMSPVPFQPRLLPQHRGDALVQVHYDVALPEAVSMCFDCGSRRVRHDRLGEPGPVYRDGRAVTHDDQAPPKLKLPHGDTLVPLASHAPVYPADALRDGVTGTVVLELTVGVDGRVLAVSVIHSSGDRRLDNAARTQVLHSWVFQPKIEHGVPVQSIGVMPVVFSL